MQYGQDVSAATDPSGRSPSAGEYGSRTGGVALGVVLIVLGSVLLAGRLIPGIDWWALWPLAIVAGGIVTMVTPSRACGWSAERVSDGIGTVLLGLVLLGNTTGYIAWQVWVTLLTLWPVLLISGGIGLLSRVAELSWMRALAPIPVWLTLVYAASLWWTGSPLPLAFQIPLPADVIINLF